MSSGISSLLIYRVAHCLMLLPAVLRSDLIQYFWSFVSPGMSSALAVSLSQSLVVPIVFVLGPYSLQYLDARFMAMFSLWIAYSLSGLSFIV